MLFMFLKKQLYFITVCIFTIFIFAVSYYLLPTPNFVFPCTYTFWRSGAKLFIWNLLAVYTDSCLYVLLISYVDFLGYSMWQQNWAERKDTSTFHTVTLSTWVRPASLLLRLNLWCISECGYIIPNKPVIYLKLKCFLFHFLFLLFFYFYYLKKF